MRIIRNTKMIRLILKEKSALALPMNWQKKITSALFAADTHTFQQLTTVVLSLNPLMFPAQVMVIELLNA